MPLKNHQYLIRQSIKNTQILGYYNDFEHIRHSTCKEWTVQLCIQEENQGQT